MTHTESSVCEILMRRFDGAKYLVPNVYFFKDDWETDLLVVQQSGYTYDIEIKVTKSDFKADVKKIWKHQILKDGAYNRIFTDYGSGVEEQKQVIHNRRPNRFYYAVPDGMINPEEVPSYAGLIYCTGSSATIVKEAPFIHKEKVRVEQDLCMKFYIYWMNGRSAAKRKRHWENVLCNQIKKLKADINELKPNTWQIA
jgi:hypothetical protein